MENEQIGEQGKRPPWERHVLRCIRKQSACVSVAGYLTVRLQLLMVQRIS